MAKVLRTTHEDGSVADVELSGVPDGLDEVESFLQSLSVGELRELVMELVEDFDAVAHRIEVRAARAMQTADDVDGDDQRPAPSVLARELEDAVIEAVGTSIWTQGDGAATSSVTSAPTVRDSMGRWPGSSGISTGDMPRTRTRRSSSSSAS